MNTAGAGAGACAAVADRLAPYAERLLSGAQAATVATHLLVCRDCRHRFEAINHSLGWVAQWPQQLASPLSWEEFAIGLDSTPTPLSTVSVGKRLAATWHAVVSVLRWHGLALMGATAALALVAGFSSKNQPIDVAALAAHNAWSLQASLRTSEAPSDRPQLLSLRSIGKRSVAGFLNRDVKVTVLSDGQGFPQIPKTGVAHQDLAIRRDGELAIASWVTEGVPMAVVGPAPLLASHACTVCHLNAPELAAFANKLL